MIATTKSLLFLQKLLFDFLQWLVKNQIALLDDLHSKDASIFYRVVSKWPVLDNDQLNEGSCTLNGSFLSLMMVWVLLRESSLQMSLRRGVVEE